MGKKVFNNASSRRYKFSRLLSVMRVVGYIAVVQSSATRGDSIWSMWREEYRSRTSYSTLIKRWLKFYTELLEFSRRST